MKKNIRIIILLLVLIAGCIAIGNVLSKYRSQTSSSKDLEIAYYVMETEYQTQQLKLDAMVPRDEPYNYAITILNSKDGRISETVMEYTIQIRTTTNLPLQFSLTRDGEDENQILDTQMIQNEDGVYYLTMATDVKEFSLNKEEHRYNLQIVFPKEYKANAEYADIIELVEVTVDSKQKI